MTFREAAAPFVACGIHPKNLVPIVPHDAKLSDRATVKKEDRGKSPGSYSASGGVWAGLAGQGLTEGFGRQDWDRFKSWPTSNVGLRAADYPAVDIDTCSEKALYLVEGVFEHCFGDSGPRRTRGGAPRALHVLRTHGGDEPIRKMTLKFELEGETHGVDILGTGQQYVITGTHPSGVPYTWTPGRELAGADEWEIPPVTANGLRQFLGLLEDNIVRAGGKVIRKETTSGSLEGISYRTLSPSADMSIVVAALNAAPNTHETLPDRNDLVRVVSGIKAALGSKADEAHDAYLEWATKDGWADTDYANTVWESVDEVRVGPDYIFARAHKYGWHEDAGLDFPDDGLEVEKNIEPEDRVGKAIRAAAALHVFCPAENNLYSLRSRKPVEGFNGSTFGRAIAPYGKTGEKSALALLYNLGNLDEVEGRVYDPGEGVLVYSATADGFLLNTWKPGPGQALDAGRFVGEDDPAFDLYMALVREFFPDPVKRKVFLDWMAYVIRNPGKKLRWAPLIFGEFGVGKDTLLRPLFWALGPNNAKEIKPDDITHRFNGAEEAQFVLIQEMRKDSSAHGSSGEARYEALKPKISGTSSGVQAIERKGVDRYDIPDRVCYAMLSNHTDAIRIPPKDRRFFVLKTHVETAYPEEYYTALYDQLERNEYTGLRQLTRMFKHRDLTGFNANQPMMTEEKEELIDDGRDNFDEWFLRQLEAGRYENRTVLTTTEITDFMMGAGAPPVAKNHSKSAIYQALKTAGFRQHPTTMRIDRRVQRVWVKGDKLLQSGTDWVKAAYDRERETKDFEDERRA